MPGQNRKKDKKTDIWMPLYIGDYTRDTMRLSTEQHGAYLLLLMEHWMSGPLPDDNAELAAITRLPAKQWAQHRPKLARFFTLADGHWYHKRVIEEKEAANHRSKTGKTNGKKGGRPPKNHNPDHNPNDNPEETYRFFPGFENGGFSEPTSNLDHNLEESSSPSPSQSDKPPYSTKDEVSTEDSTMGEVDQWA